MRDGVFLKGPAIALPMLEAMVPVGRAATSVSKPTKRFVCLSNLLGMYPKAFFPSEAGAKYEMPETLKPLEKHRQDFTIFSNLDHGNTNNHQGSAVLLSGVRPHLAAHFPEGNISLDQKIAEYVGAETRFSSMTLNVNTRSVISLTRTGVQLPAIDLHQMYSALFLADSKDQTAIAAERLKRHSSILDVVMEEAHSVSKRLGKQDQRKFDEYLTAVRTLEKKIVQQEPWLDKPKPKTDYPKPTEGQGTEADLRAMMELIVLAIQTDSTRAITLTSGFVTGDFGLKGSYHAFSHHGERPNLVAAKKRIELSQMKQMAYLFDLLKAQEDTINGGTLFDHTSIFFGCGMATGGHSTKNLPLLLAGGGFKHGEHKIYPKEKGKRVPAANLLLSILQNHGVETDRFGTSAGTLTGLERSNS